MQQERMIFCYSVRCKGEKGEHFIKSMKKRTSKLLPPEIKTQDVYTGKKLSTCFNVKDQSKFEH